jgi:hypothetical protein
LLSTAVVVVDMAAVAVAVAAATRRWVVEDTAADLAVAVQQVDLAVDSAVMRVGSPVVARLGHSAVVARRGASPVVARLGRSAVVARRGASPVVARLGRSAAVAR